MILVGASDPLNEDGVVGAEAAVEPPGGVDRAVDEVPLQVAAGLECAGPRAASVFECLGVLAGQDRAFGAEAVFRGVEAGGRLAPVGLRPGAPFRVLPVGPELLGAGL